MTTTFLFSKLKKSKAQTGNTILIVRKPKTPISKPTFQQQQRQTFTSIDSLSLTINRKLFFTLRKRKVSPLIQVHALNPKLLILQNTLTFFPIHLISLFYPGGGTAVIPTPIVLFLFNYQSDNHQSLHKKASGVSPIRPRFTIKPQISFNFLSFILLLLFSNQIQLVP